LLVLLLLGALSVTATGQNGSGVQGIVYVDSNRNGVMETTEPRAEGLSVTSGDLETVTGADGTFALPLSDGAHSLYCSRPEPHGVSSVWTCATVTAPGQVQIAVFGRFSYLPILFK
jgi:hypothetical protein